MCRNGILDSQGGTKTLNPGIPVGYRPCYRAADGGQSAVIQSECSFFSFI